MLRVFFIFLLFLSVPAFADDTLLEFSSIYKGKEYKTIVSENNFSSVPKWSENKNIPLSISDAELEAKNYLSTLELTELVTLSVTLKYIDDYDRYLYQVTVISKPNLFSIKIPLVNHAKIIIVVLLNGKIIIPNVKKAELNSKM